MGEFSIKINAYVSKGGKEPFSFYFLEPWASKVLDFFKYLNGDFCTRAIWPLTFRRFLI